MPRLRGPFPRGDAGGVEDQPTSRDERMPEMPPVERLHVHYLGAPDLGLSHHPNTTCASILQLRPRSPGGTAGQSASRICRANASSSATQRWGLVEPPARSGLTCLRHGVRTARFQRAFRQGFQPCPALVAQGIEHRSPKAGVAGSNPAGGTNPFPQVKGRFHASPPFPSPDQKTGPAGWRSSWG